MRSVRRLLPPTRPCFCKPPSKCSRRKPSRTDTNDGAGIGTTVVADYDPQAASGTSCPRLLSEEAAAVACPGSAIRAVNAVHVKGAVLLPKQAGEYRPRSRQGERPSHLGFRIAIVLVTAALASVPAFAASASQPLNPGDPDDAAILRAAGDDVGHGHVRNSCGAEVRPLISHPAPGVAVVIEVDPTGACSGSNPPSSLTVLVQSAGAWRLSMGTTGAGYRVAKDGSGMPTIVVQYPPSQVDCPVLSWTGGRYSMTRSCRAPGS